MTFVAAKRFGDRVIILSDTAISDEGTGKKDQIPGRLKSVVVGQFVTIAYAGATNQAIDAIRKAKDIIDSGASVNCLEKSLVASSMEYCGNLDFIIVSHIKGLSIKRVWNGNLSSHMDEVYIGRRDLYKAILSHEASIVRGVVPNSREEDDIFFRAFIKILDDFGFSSDVGGIAMITNCSPYGHVYESYSSARAWDVVSWPQGETSGQFLDRLNGQNQFRYAVSSSRLRGVSVVGVLLNDLEIGYLYSPISEDSAQKIVFRKSRKDCNVTNMEKEMQRIIDEKAILYGGIEVELSPIVRRELNPRELEEVLLHASKATFPTHIELRYDSIWVECTSSRGGHGTSVSKALLDPDPVWVLKTTIDRMNARLARNGYGSD